MSKKENFNNSYDELNESLNGMNDRGKYASWLIIGVFLGRIYQYIRGLRKKIARRRKK